MKKPKLFWVLLFVLLPTVLNSKDLQRNTMLLSDDFEDAAFYHITALSKMIQAQVWSENEKDNEKKSLLS